MYICQYIFILCSNVMDNKGMNDRPITLIEDENNRRLQLKNWIDTHFNGSQADLVRRYKFNQGEISALLRGSRPFGETKARALEETIDGMPARFLDQRPDNIQACYAPADASIVSIYEFDVQGAMGNGLTLPEQPGVIKKWEVSKEWARRNLPANTGLNNLCIVTGFGDSMRPLFNPGDPLIVDMGVKTIELDATYFFRLGNEGFIKRIQRVPGVGKLVISENKIYENWVIKDDSDLEVIGRVLKVWESSDL